MITTEARKDEKRTDFYEYYWAHRMVDTTWAHLQAWLFELMLRNPFTRVPRGLIGVWLLLWAIAVTALAIAIWQLRPGDEDGRSWLGAILVAAVTAAVGGLSGLLVSYFGDVARYVKAKPANVARRQEIRENGVQLLETLMGVTPGGKRVASDYDRIVVVGHSLGSIVAYDILSHAFARINEMAMKPGEMPADQPARIRLEAGIRRAAGLPESAPASFTSGPAATEEADAEPWSIDGFQALQAAAREELNLSGNPWIVSDFVTLGSPLTHAEFLLARDRERLSEAKLQRQLPSCPPTLEYDLSTRHYHFTYRPKWLRKIGDSRDPKAPRIPHHAALFAYTRWSNVYSPHRFIFWGDIISGPIAALFGLEAQAGTVKGIRDIAVQPGLDEKGRPAPGERYPFFTHTRYWSLDPAATTIPHHVEALRKVLRLDE